MRIAFGEDGLKILREVAGGGVAHLDRRRQIGFPLGQDIGQVFPSMLASGKDTAYLLPLTTQP